MTETPFNPEALEKYRAGHASTDPSELPAPTAIRPLWFMAAALACLSVAALLIPVPAKVTGTVHVVAQRKGAPPLLMVTFPPEHWGALVPGQRVRLGELEGGVMTEITSVVPTLVIPSSPLAGYGVRDGAVLGVTTVAAVAVLKPVPTEDAQSATVQIGERSLLTVFLSPVPEIGTT